jgi:hypothetical protein
VFHSSYGLLAIATVILSAGGIEKARHSNTPLLQCWRGKYPDLLRLVHLAGQIVLVSTLLHVADRLGIRMVEPDWRFR